MSVQAGSSCFSSVQLAAQAVAAGEVGKVVPAGSVVYVVDAVADASGSITYTLTDMAGVAPSVVHVAAPSYPPCALLDASDATVIGWLVAGAWLATYAVMVLRKGFA